MCEEYRFAVYILEAGRTVKEILISPSQNINSISVLFPNSNYVFVWKGRILSKNRTFLSYEMEPESVIVALKNSEDEVNRWLKNSLETELLRCRIMTSLYPSVLLEKARLSDIRQMRVDDNPRILRKCYDIISVPHIEKRLQESPIISRYIKPSCPASQPIPVVWN